MPDPEKKHHRVVFVKRNNGCFMVPGHIVVGSGDRIRFSAAGNTGKVQLYFPDPSIFTPLASNLIEIDPNNSATAKVDLEIGNGSGIFPFSAYCQGTESFAIAGSDPEIIIQT